MSIPPKSNIHTSEDLLMEDHLRKRNFFLERLLDLQNQEIRRLRSYDLNNLDTFYSTRESIIKIVSYLDNRISRIFDSKTSNFKPSGPVLSSILTLLGRKSQLISEILKLDNELLLNIQENRKLISKELQSVQNVIKAHKQYRSNV